MVSKVEKWKNEKNPVKVKEEIHEVYSKEGIEAVEESENPDAEFERLKWYGLYRHNQGSPNYFMHRIKIPNGVMTAEQVRKVVGNEGVLRGRESQPQLREDVHRRNDPAGHTASLDRHPRHSRHLE